MRKIIVIALLMVAQQAMAADLYDPQNGNYLGQLGGSKYSADSINNPYGEYGSEYSNKSPNNPYATEAPVIIDRGR